MRSPRRSRRRSTGSGSAGAWRRLTDIQRESVTLAYYGGYSYREVAGLLNVALGTIKTRIRDGLIRMRDCIGVSLVRLLRADMHTLTGVYALDAIERPSAERFEHHLSRCQSCDNEVRGLQETATRFALAVAPGRRRGSRRRC